MTVRAESAAERLIAIENLIAGGFVLVPLPPNSKRPIKERWNVDPTQWLTTPTAARAHMAVCPRAGVGLLHSESRTLALDIDHEGAALALAAVGIDLTMLLADNPYKVRGMRGEKPLYRVPDGLNLKMRALSWPDPSGKKGPGGRPAPLTIVELRAGPVQDVMPPSNHPGGLLYTWAGPVPTRRTDLPICPPELLSLLDRWPTLERVMKAACPWADSDPSPLPDPLDLDRLGNASSGPDSVIGQFNNSRTLGEVLNASGYKGGPRGPWLYPNSQSGVAGVKVRPERTRSGAEVVMSWHAGDPLGDGRPRDAFGVWTVLVHDVDTYRASTEQMRGVVKAGARLLGLPELEQGRTEKTSRHTSTDVIHTALPAEDWGDLSALPASTQPVPTLPAELLPAPLATWITDEARAAGLPLEMVAAPVIVGAAGLIGARLTLRNARNAPAVPANPWCMVCAPPGSRKSHAIKVGGRSLERAEQREAERLAAQRSHLEAVRERCAAQLEALQNNLRLALKGGKSPAAMPTDDELSAAHDALAAAGEALKPARYVVSDATIEKLGIILNDNPAGVTLLRDELTAWLRAFEKPGRESERAQWLELANGNAVLRIDRIIRETLHVSPASAGLLGGIQPGPLRQLINEQDGGGDGLLQRFQIFIWPDQFPDFDQEAQRQPVNAEARAMAYDVLDALIDLDLVMLGSTSQSGDGAPLTYTSEAQHIYDAWEIQHEAAKRDTRTSEVFRSHIAKQNGTFARLALIFHALEVAAIGVRSHPHTAKVGLTSAALAAVWCDYLAAHARKLWSEGRRSDVLDACEVLRFIERGSIKDGQKVSEARIALAQGRAGMTRKRLTLALDLLSHCGAVKIIALPVGGKGGRPSPLLRLHPQALDLLDALRD